MDCLHVLCSYTGYLVYCSSPQRPHLLYDVNPPEQFSSGGILISYRVPVYMYLAQMYILALIYKSMYYKCFKLESYTCTCI